MSDYTTVILEDCGPRKIATIQALRKGTPLGLREARDIVESTPATIDAGTPENAALMVLDLTHAGATAHTVRSQQHQLLVTLADGQQILIRSGIPLDPDRLSVRRRGAVADGWTLPLNESERAHQPLTVYWGEY